MDSRKGAALTEREQFEVWVKSRGGDCMKRNGTYLSSMTREWFLAWQAARAAPAQPDRTKVICPNCCHQFRAIPLDVQDQLFQHNADPLPATR
jgi:hypothetical protein